MSVCTRADGTVYAQWVEDGKRVRKYFGKGLGAITRAKDFELTRERKATVQVGPLFDEIATAYATAYKTRAGEKSIYNLIYRLSSIILPRLGNVYAVCIDHAAIDRYVAERAKLVKMTTIHRELSDIRAILNWGVKRKYIAFSGMAGYEMPKRDDAIVLPISGEDIARIIEVSPEHLKRAITLSYFTGLRPGEAELLALRYNQVRWSANTITIISAKKGGVDRREIPIHQSLPLRAWYEADGCNDDSLIISWKGKQVRSILVAWRRAKMRAGIVGKVPLYAIRHSFVTAMIHAGVDPHTVASISGHSINMMLRIYTHTLSGTKRAAIDALPGLHPLGAKSGDLEKGKN